METIHTLQFVTEDGVIVTLQSDKPWPEFEGRYLSARIESRAAYKSRVRLERE
jgi:hypothetical protein